MFLRHSYKVVVLHIVFKFKNEIILNGRNYNARLRGSETQLINRKTTVNYVREWENCEQGRTEGGS